MSELYYPPNTICFYSEQVYWLLDYLPMLRDGKYPPEPSSYTDITKVQKSRSCKGGFETPVEIAAELMVRMKACGLDGYLAIQHYAYGVPIEEMGTERDYIESRIKKVVSYISSGTHRRWVDKEKRRGLNYKDWCKMYRVRRWDRRGAV